jgi:hypothetical protein
MRRGAATAGAGSADAAAPAAIKCRKLRRSMAGLGKMLVLDTVTGLGLK